MTNHLLRLRFARRYGWGDIPMLTVYRADMEGEDGQLPVLPWNRTIA